ncbi:Rlf2p [Sugiyamaella lignohabitans]|uniref:Rlf2p n=1 Tax=Sugiyamaella lignohabitans TaxID=796027 RepID=A0A167E9S3_9ASCO|nr:Rlf2p [Sugiyamaella lignohabitans]ANB13815.1 Rlf2p [Sugiyamaella lignohabitans]
MLSLQAKTGPMSPKDTNIVSGKSIDNATPRDPVETVKTKLCKRDRDNDIGQGQENSGIPIKNSQSKNQDSSLSNIESNTHERSSKDKTVKAKESSTTSAPDTSKQSELPSQKTNPSVTQSDSPVNWTGANQNIVMMPNNVPMNVQGMTPNMVPPPNMIFTNMLASGMIPPNMIPPGMVPANMISPNAIPPTTIPLNMIPPQMIPPHMLPPNMVSPPFLPSGMIPVSTIQDGESTPSPERPNKKQKIGKTKEEREQERLDKENERLAKLEAEQQKKAEKMAEKMAEKQRREEEKEEKKRQKEEEKRLKEEEKRLKEAAKEEEKRQKEEEKRLKEAAKEEERRQKEEEKRLKEEAKEQARLKEERKQLRMDRFFKKVQKPTSAETPAGSSESKEARSFSSSIIDDSNNSSLNATKSTASESTASVESSSNGSENSTEESKADLNTSPCTFDEIFLPFHIKVDTTLCARDSWIEKRARNELPSTDIDIFLKTNKQQRGFSPDKTTVEIIQLMNTGSLTESRVMELLNKLPRRHLKFAENIRPPYVGTFSKPTPRIMVIQPWKRFIAPQDTNPETLVSTTDLIPDTTRVELGNSLLSINYDYDSDYDWVNDNEEGDEEIGEDIGEEDESESDDDDNEMAGFVEDESDTPTPSSSSDEGSPTNTNRRRIIGPLASLVAWNDGTEPHIFDHMETALLIDLKGDASIDPFKDYWASSPAEATAVGTALPSTASPTSSATATPAKLIPDHLLRDFLTKIQGSDKNQTLLVETLKIEFNSVSKSTIRDTIKACAKRVGAKENDKRWVINPPFADKYGILTAPTTNSTSTTRQASPFLAGN